MMQSLSPPLPLNCHRPGFASRDDEAAWYAECQRLAERVGPGYWVAPRCRFPAAFSDANGNPVMLAEGDAVKAFEHFTPDQISTLFDREVLVCGSESGGFVQNTPADARFVALQSFTSSRGLILPGSEVRPEFLSGGQDALDSLVKRRLVRDSKAAEEPEEIAFRASLAEVKRADTELASATQQLAENDTPKNRAAFFEARDQRDVANVRHVRASSVVIAKRGTDE